MAPIRLLQQVGAWQVSVNVRPYKDGRRHLVDVWVKRPADGVLLRDRKVVGGTRLHARNWGLERERALLASGGRPEPKKKDPPAFDAFAPDWLRIYTRAAANSEETIRTKKSHITIHLVPFFKSTRLDRIDAKMIETFTAQLFAVMRGKPEGERVRKRGTGQRPIRPRTVAHVLSTLHRMLWSAQEWGLIEKLPKFTRVRVPEQPFAFYSLAEAQRLIDAASDDLARVVLLFALHTGCRASELLALKWGDLDLKLKLVTFSRGRVRGVERGRTKSGRVRTVDLSELLVRELSTHRARRGAVLKLDMTNDYVFALQGKPLDLDMLHRIQGRATRRAGLRLLRWHDLRHTFASILAASGTPIRQVQAWLGHSSLAMTMRYSHLMPSTGREYLSAFGTGHIKATEEAPREQAKKT